MVLVPRGCGRERGENSKSIEDGMLEGVVMERGVVAAIAEVPVLGYAGAEVERLADVDANSGVS
jgi:hypothetical protein